MQGSCVQDDSEDTHLSVLINGCVDRKHVCVAACASVSHLLGYLQIPTFQLQEPPSGHRRPHQVVAPEMRNRPDLHSDGKQNWPTWSCHFATAKASPVHRSNRPAENNPPNHRGRCHQSSEKCVPTRQNQVWQAAHFAKSGSLTMIE